MTTRFSLALALIPSLFACGDDGSGMGETGAATSMATSDGSSGTAAVDESTGEPAPFDEAEVIQRAHMFATELVKINVDPFPSAHGLADTVNVHVDAGAADLYRTIDPEAPAELDFPEGTLVVKEHLNTEGAYDGFLMMYQGPEGYDPDNRDWFFARIDGTGATRETGAVGFCIGCHVPSPSFLFGVPADNQL